MVDSLTRSDRQLLPTTAKANWKASIVSPVTALSDHQLFHALHNGARTGTSFR